MGQTFVTAAAADVATIPPGPAALIVPTADAMDADAAAADTSLGEAVASGGRGDTVGAPGVKVDLIRVTSAPISSVSLLIRSRIGLKKEAPGIPAVADGGAFCPEVATACTDCNRF